MERLRGRVREEETDRRGGWGDLLQGQVDTKPISPKVDVTASRRSYIYQQMTRTMTGTCVVVILTLVSAWR